MPTNKLGEFVRRLSTLEQQMSEHLTQSIDVHTAIKGLQTDAYWTRWIVTGIAGGIGAIVVALIIYALHK